MKKILKIVMSFIIIVTVMLGVAPGNNIKAGVGDTIAETFPDDNMAQAVADKIASGDVNHVITSTDITSSVDWSNGLVSKNIASIDGIDHFTNLKDLDLSSNQLTGLPEGIGNLSSLRKLYLTHNQLMNLPEGIGNLSSLEYLVLSYNELTSVPESIGNLSSLNNLDLSSNQLTSVPKSIGDLSSLNDLNLSSNQLTSFPEGIGNLSSLKKLYLTYNQLTNLPEGIDNLSSLEYLVLSYNELISLPESISNLSRLTYLNLSSNQLTSLPKSIGNLSGLKDLDLSSNQLTSLPENIGDLSFFIKLYLENNLLPSDFADVLKGLGMIMVNYKAQDHLEVDTNPSVFTIKGQSDLDVIDYPSILRLKSNRVLSSNHEYMLENYLDENNQPINITDYIQDGVVIKSGKVFANVRATGTGLFPNNSEHAVTTEFIELNFEVQAPVQFQLSFNLNGGSGAAPTSQSLPENSIANAVENPTREGYAFKNWNTAEDGSGVTWDFGTTTMPANDVTLYAQWSINQYELSFNLNGGEGIAPVSQDLDFGALATQPQPPIREGYTFNGWNDLEDGSGTSWNFSSTTMPANDVMLYAQWSINQYELSFNLNGGEGTSPVSQDLDFGALAIQPQPPIREGYTFNGWNDLEDGSGISWDFASSKMPANNVILYAQWEKNVDPIVEYTLRFDLNGGQGVAPTNQILNEGQKASKPTSPSREEYVFKGWSTTKDGSGTTWNFETDTMPANDVTLYAQWSKQTLPVTGYSSNAISLSSLIVLSGAMLIVINKRRSLK